jgi:dolichol-phosphate mannosyltransferase
MDIPDNGRLPVDTTLRRLRKPLLEWLRFGLVGISGVVVNQAILVVLTETFGIYYLVSAAIATLGSTTWNFTFIELWAFAGRRSAHSLSRRYLAFILLNVALLGARIPALALLTEAGRFDYALANIWTLLGLFVIRLFLSDQYLWGARGSVVSPAISPSGLATDTAKYAYDVAGLVAIDSDVELRELRYFLTDRPGRPDLRIRIGIVGPRPAMKVRFDDVDGELIYREHLGPFSANFSLRMGDPIEIKVSPLLAISPHVVYTNIVEAFLRFLLVSKGYVLLHSAAIADDQGATLMSAQTDTGKTSTVISLVRSRRYRFLSDDMTIVDPRGEALSYPKPMTLSFHTMGVAKDGRLTVRDRAALAIQARLHSKTGRETGRALGKRNLPIMTMNAIVQFLVPPPKYRIDALFPCAVGGRAPIRNIVLMERGPNLMETLSVGSAVHQLIENTDDAYGFPPFDRFAPEIVINGDDYLTLRAKEEALLARAIDGANRWHLRVVGHEWAERLPGVIAGTALVGVGPGRPRLDPAGDDLPNREAGALPRLEPIGALATISDPAGDDLPNGEAGALPRLEPIGALATISAPDEAEPAVAG